MKNLTLYSDNLSIEQQTGWKRRHPKMLLQDLNMLLKITKYDYDLTDKDFTLYAKDRGCMEGAGIPDFSDPDYQAHKEWMKENKIEETTPLNGDRGQWRRWVSEHWRTFEEFQASGDLSQALSGKFYSDEDRRSYWQCILIARAKLQDSFLRLLKNKKIKKNLLLARTQAKFFLSNKNDTILCYYVLYAIISIRYLCFY